MLKAIWFLSLLWFYSGLLYAKDLNILQFKQAINLNNTETLDFELKGLPQDAEFWTAVYVVAQQGKPDGQANMAIQIQNQGGLNKAHPRANPFIEQLNAAQLPRANGISLLDLPELSQAVKQISNEEIDTPALPEGSVIRAYVQLLDWTPVYNQTDTVKLSFSFPTQDGLYAVATYIVVGQGPKPKELVNIHTEMAQLQPPQEQASTLEHAGSETAIAEVQQQADSVATDGTDETNRGRLLLALLAIILLGYWLWRRRR